ncbi:MAG: hypothetical protein EPO40_21925 [Myxococcaceae bacterium]|nr:MAG: hypothetical protein EPO40_21925 [Myxococcaceae bacterium]
MQKTLILGLLALTTGCATTGALRPHEVPGAWIALNASPVHLGDQNYSGQSFNQSRVGSQSWCSIVRVPRATSAAVRIEGLRNTERPTNQIRIDGESAMLPMLLSQGTGGSSLSAQMSTTWEVQLAAGPHEICVVAGRNDLNPADIDDFEFTALLLRAEGTSPAEIENRVIEVLPDVGRAPTEVAQRAPAGWNH